MPKLVSQDGMVTWFNDAGERHCEDGPAIIWKDGTRFWYRNSKLHREDGPAVIYSDGTHKWYINGHDITNKIKKMGQRS